MSADNIPTERVQNQAVSDCQISAPEGAVRHHVSLSTSAGGMFTRNRPFHITLSDHLSVAYFLIFPLLLPYHNPEEFCCIRT